MGPSKVRGRIPELISRACRLPRKVADRVSELSDTLYNEHLRPLQSKRGFAYTLLITAILLINPYMMLTFVIPPQVEFTAGNEVDSTTYCDIRPIPEESVTHAVLLNNTPFDPSNYWEIDTQYSSDYDLNRYTKNESDGYHLTFPQDDITLLVFSRRIQIPIHNYSDISISVEIEGVSGSAGIYLEVYADIAREMDEAVVSAGQIVQVNASAPLIEARQVSSYWLGSIFFRFQTGSSVGAQIIVRNVIIEATFTTKLSRVQLDIQSTENVSLYENPSMKYLESPLELMLVRNNDSSSASIYRPVRVHDELYLPPGTYSGEAYWHYWSIYGPPIPDPSNATSWAPNMNFTVVEDAALEIDVRVFVIRIDIDLSHRVLLSRLRIYYMGGYRYEILPDIVGSTLYTPIPDYFYIPGGVDSLRVEMDTWSPFSPRWSWYRYQALGSYFHIETNPDVSISSRNHRLSVVLPYVTIGDAVLGLGDFLLLALGGLLLIKLGVTLHRVLRHSDLRHRLSDSRLLPIVLLGLGVFLPWSKQLLISPSSSYVNVYWISWFSMPIMIRWTDRTAIQLLYSTPDWWIASLISIFLLFVPVFYACLSLSSPETGAFDRRFALALFLPYLVVLSGFSFSVLSPDTISFGPLLIVAALPVWLMRIALRRLGLTK